jgi:hypothetical protein
MAKKRRQPGGKKEEYDPERELREALMDAQLYGYEIPEHELELLRADARWHPDADNPYDSPTSTLPERLLWLFKECLSRFKQ